MDRPHQVFLLERFSQEALPTRLDRAHGSGDIAVTCDEHDWRMISLRGLALEIQYVDVRKFDIQNQTSWRVGFRIPNIRSSGCERNHSQIEGRKKHR